MQITKEDGFFDFIQSIDNSDLIADRIFKCFCRRTKFILTLKLC